LLYHQFAWSYDYVAAFVSLGRWKSWVIRTLPLLTGKRILEIGFGPGHLITTAMRNNLNIIGLDESEQMIRRTSIDLSAAGYTLPILRGNALFLPFFKSHFDQVVATFPSEYILNAQAISEIYRVLIPGGQLIVLPFARLKGKLWNDKTTGRIFDYKMITQNQCGKYCLVMMQQGFEITINQIDDDKSSVIFIIATKPDNPSDRTEIL